MATRVLDLKGLQCPQPQLKMTIEIQSMHHGDILEAIADCDSFEDDVRGWAARTHKVILWFRNEDSGKRCQVRV